MGFVRTTSDKVVYYTIPAFTKSGLVEHGFTTRHGGVSKGSFSSLNLAFHVGDEIDKVRQNRAVVASLFGIDIGQWVAGEQIHDNRVHLVTKDDLGKGATTITTALPVTDALITNVPGIMLSSYYADCVPIFFLDAKNRAIGLAHAGWKGTHARIGRLTLLRMMQEFQTNPSECQIAIGPSIGPCCYEVDRYVYEKFAEEFPTHHQFLTPADADKWLLDLWQVNKQDFIDLGVQDHQITMSGLCTSCHVQDFFSYRKESGVTGRQASLIMLKEGNQFHGKNRD